MTTIGSHWVLHSSVSVYNILNVCSYFFWIWDMNYTSTMVVSNGFKINSVWLNENSFSNSVNPLNYTLTGNLHVFSTVIDLVNWWFNKNLLKSISVDDKLIDGFTPSHLNLYEYGIGLSLTNICIVSINSPNSVGNA